MVKLRLRTHQLRILKLLAESGGPLTRTKIIALTRSSKDLTHRALGLEDKAARERFESASGPVWGRFPSLITLGLVERFELDIDGLKEIAYGISEEGEEVYKQLKNDSRSSPPG